MVESAVLRLVIDEQHCTKVKLRPTLPGWHTLIPANKLPRLGCSAHGKICSLTSEKHNVKVSCVVEAQRAWAGRKKRETEKRLRKRICLTNAFQTCLPFGNRRFNDVSNSCRKFMSTVRLATIVTTALTYVIIYKAIKSETWHLFSLSKI